MNKKSVQEVRPRVSISHRGISLSLSLSLFFFNLHFHDIWIKPLNISLKLMWNGLIRETFEQTSAIKGYLLDTQLVLTHAVTPLIWADREVIWQCRWLFYYHTLLCFLNVKKNLLFQKKLWPNRFPSKHGKLTFDGERYSQKNFFDFKVCFSHFLKAKMECDRLISPMKRGENEQI